MTPRVIASRVPHHAIGRATAPRRLGGQPVRVAAVLAGAARSGSPAAAGTKGRV